MVTKFEPGTKVRLKSGGPTMTTSEYINEAQIQCSWFIKNKLENGTFLEDQLEVVQDKYTPVSHIGGRRADRRY